MGRSLAVAVCLVAACVFACAVASCCGAATSNARPCAAPSSDDAGDGGTDVRVVSPALDCPSRLCLVTPRADGPIALCTDECASDHDCAAMGNDYCASGYACGTGAGFPRAVCVCRAR